MAVVHDQHPQGNAVGSEIVLHELCPAVLFRLGYLCKAVAGQVHQIAGFIQQKIVHMDGLPRLIPHLCHALALQKAVDDGNRYYFGEDGVLATDWLTLDGETYYLGEDGIPRTGKQTMEDGVRLFREDGAMVTGWEDEADGRHHYDESGLMQTGWLDLDGKRYFLSEEGTMQTGWLEQGEYRYYLFEDGSAAVGKQSIDGRTWYFTPKGIQVVLVNKDNPIPDDWTWDTVEVEKDRPIQRIAAEPLRQMLADCRAAGNDCYLNSAYRTHKQQIQILELRTQEYEDKGMTHEEAYEESLKTVALPGTSEHELGLSTDLVGKEANEWLAVHCWEYGFILRYPADKEDITGITNEPWHFRYVGVEVAMDMKDTGLCLEEYLGAV